jgi:hypothetical protein
MHSTNTNLALNELVVILNRSLPMYLSHAAPWVAYGHQEAQQTLDLLVADARHYATRISELLVARRHTVDLGEFPMAFTSLHDVSLDFLIEHLIAHQKRDLYRIEAITNRLSGDPEARAVAHEVLTNGQSHLKAIQSLQAQPTTATP